MIRVLSALLMIAAIWWAALVYQPVEAADPPLVRPDHTYAVIWQCQPTFFAEAVSAAMNGGQPLSPCYAERLKVRIVYKSGWWQVVDLADNTIYTINSAQVMALREHDDNPRQASR